MYKFKRAVFAYKAYAEELYNKLSNIEQKTDIIESNVKNAIKSSTKKK